MSKRWNTPTGIGILQVKKEAGGGEMKLTKLELTIWRLLLEAAHPMSVAEISERLTCCFLPMPVISFAGESIIHNKEVVEAGIHQSCTNGVSKRAIFYSLTQSAQECEQQR